MLESAGGIAEAEGHIELKQAQGYNKGGPLLVLVLYWDLPVATGRVQGKEEFGLSKGH